MRINAEFKNMIPPLSEEEFAQLERNIVAEKGCREAIITWNGVIVDGHNRYVICEKHGFKFDVKEMFFAGKKEAQIWIAENQLGRRNLSDAMRIELAGKRAELMKSKGSGKSGGSVRAKIAKDAGVCEQNVYKYYKIVGNGVPELIDKVRCGEISIGAAYKGLMVETTVVREIFDDTGVVDLMEGLREVEGLYGFIGEVVGVCGGDRRLVRGLRRHLGVVEGCVLG